MGIRQRGKLLLLVMLLCLPVSCVQGTDNSPGTNLSSSNRPGRNPRLNLAEILPGDWQYVETHYLDTDATGEYEWIVVYRFDLLDNRDPRGAPIGAVVYKLDDNIPPNIMAYELRPQDGDYLCECDCRFDMENVLSGLTGAELVVRDRCDEETTKLTIFYWDSISKKYVSPGHFLAGDIEVSLDQVTTRERLSGRAQLTEIETYYPYENRTYYQPGDQARPLGCTEEEIRFCYGEPEGVVCFRYPEKAVLGFYNQYNDDEKASAYFIEKVRGQLGQCDASECGCIAPRHEIARVLVTDLQLEPVNETQDPDWAIVTVKVDCERRDGVDEGERYIRWHLVREGGCWWLERPE
jgi:hypothetical protein